MALTKQDRERIAEALREGQSQRVVARAFGCSVSTVNAVAREHAGERSAPKKAGTDFDQPERLRVINKLFDQIDRALNEDQTPHRLQVLAVALAVAIDKRRLEDGEATSRAEVTGDDARERIARRLDELAARRREKGVA